MPRLACSGTAINILLHFILCFGKQYSLVHIHTHTFYDDANICNESSFCVFFSSHCSNLTPLTSAMLCEMEKVSFFFSSFAAAATTVPVCSLPLFYVERVISFRGYKMRNKKKEFLTSTIADLHKML